MRQQNEWTGTAGETILGSFSRGDIPLELVKSMATQKSSCPPQSKKSFRVAAGFSVGEMFELNRTDICLRSTLKGSSRVAVVVVSDDSVLSNRIGEMGDPVREVAVSIPDEELGGSGATGMPANSLPDNVIKHATFTRSCPTCCSL